MLLVTIINGEDLMISHSKLFETPAGAFIYFVKIIKENFPEISKELSMQDYKDYFDDGYFADLTHFSVVVQDVNQG